MKTESIENHDARKAAVRELALAAGFSCARFLESFEPRGAAGTAAPPGYAEGAPALLVVALPYGNDDPDERSADPRSAEDDRIVRGDSAAPETPARIAPFARRNYYAEAVARLKSVSARLRKCFGGARSDYRILCNSPIPEKPLAEASGVGAVGRNTLVITREAGSLVILAAMTLPFAVGPEEPAGGAAADPGVGGPSGDAARFPLCRGCAACVAACPTGALDLDGGFDERRCIQWYASGNGEVPADVAAAWGDRLYGCTVCQDVCPHNARPIRGTATERGALPAVLDAAELLAMPDEELKERFRGTAMGMAWLGPGAIRRNAALAAGSQ